MLIIMRSKLHYTNSGIITPIGGRLVHMCTTKVFDSGWIVYFGVQGIY